MVPFTSERGGLTRNYWDTWHLAGVKILKFWAADNNLKVKVMGSIDGTDFADTVEAEFDVTTTTPVTKRILTYWPYLQVQVKPATSAQHGTLSVLAVGTTITAESDTELSATIDTAGLATQTTLAAILAKIIAAPSTEANQGLILTALGLIATEATAGDIKTATEALAALISAGALAVSLGELPDTAAGDLADINAASASIDGKLPALVGGKIPVDASVSIDSVDIGDVDITEFPAGNLGQQAKAASLSVAPATDITDPTYIGDVKFGEELPAGTQLIGKVGIDQTTPGTTNLVNVNGGASQSADIKVTLDSESVAVTGPLTDTELRASDIKVTLDSESVAVTGPLTDAQLTTQALAKESTLGSVKTAVEALAGATPDTISGDLASMSADLGTIQADIATVKADIALMKADLAAILAILES